MRNRPSCTKFPVFWPRNHLLARKPAFPDRKSCQAQQTPWSAKSKPAKAPWNVPERGSVAKKRRVPLLSRG